ncbi:MAG TPA: C1 family peptidase [Bacteroidales bacterium]|nr:C1 family peptidase [Bacteroidales bacterium]
MKRIVFSMLLSSFLVTGILAQESGYSFTDQISLPATPVKNQNRSGTCWSFSGISFFESELLREGKGEYDLSEMYVVRTSYAKKAVKYARMHGTINFDAGGAFNDVTNTMSSLGIVPESAYPGLSYGEKKHVHGELNDAFKAYMSSIIGNKKLSTAWDEGFEGLLDAYFGTYPENFTYKGKAYTPESFETSLGLDMDDYVMITSFSHHPFYKPFILEVPDNWAWGDVYNVKIDEMTDVIDYSLEHGYTVAWATDVSEKGFSWRNGIAVVPSEDIADIEGLERTKWDELSDREKSALIYDFSIPHKEKVITQEMRQFAFDNFETTDDHGMHITGMAKDQNGTPFYLVKNSWGTTGSPYNGYLYASKAYVKYKTTSILVNKNGIPPALRKKLGLK